MAITVSFRKPIMNISILEESSLESRIRTVGVVLVR